MIKTVSLKNFKCFQGLDLPCSGLTLLCGLNGAGKSSILQALLLLRQSFESGDLEVGRLLLGGPHVDIGTGRDVLSEDAVLDADSVGIGFQTDTPSLGFASSFGYARASNALDARDRLTIPSALCEIPPLGGTLVYVSAERVGPRKSYPYSESQARRGELGENAEYAWNLLSGWEHQLPANDPRCTEAAGGRVRAIVNHWLQVVSPGARLDFEVIEDADAIVAGFVFDRHGDVSTRRYRTTNVGFGLSYVLPVIIGLLAPPGALCLLENPEAHLHPRGQTKLAELCVRAALSGVQVIVETHSDHFMDGVRIAVRDGLIATSMTRFHYFARSGAVASVTSPEIDLDGRLSEWPDGFFDQHEENLARLLAPKS